MSGEAGPADEGGPGAGGGEGRTVGEPESDGGNAGPDGGPVHVVLITGPADGTLRRLGRRLVEERLAACVNVLPGVESVYRWQGEVETAEEALAVVKTTEGRLQGLEERVRELHPYDEPEFVALRVDDGSASYLGWVADSVRDGP